MPIPNNEDNILKIRNVYYNNIFAYCGGGECRYCINIILFLIFKIPRLMDG
jgi:hypothetical protein